jgi:hypothetical protein
MSIIAELQRFCNASMTCDINKTEILSHLLKINRLLGIGLQTCHAPTLSWTQYTHNMFAIILATQSPIRRPRAPKRLLHAPTHSKSQDPSGSDSAPQTPSRAALRSRGRPTTPLVHKPGSCSYQAPDTAWPVRMGFAVERSSRGDHQAWVWDDLHAGHGAQAGYMCCVVGWGVDGA